MAHRQQQRALGIQHAVQVDGHAVDALRKKPQLVVAPHGDRVGKVAAAIGLHAGRDVPQRLQLPVHCGIGQHGQQQQRGQRQPADVARPVEVGWRDQRELHTVAVSAWQRNDPWRIELLFARAVALIKAAWVGVELHRWPIDAHGNRQTLRQRGGLRRVRRAADVLRQMLGIVLDQRPRKRLPTALQPTLAAEQKDRRRAQRQQHEECDQPALDAVRQPVCKAVPPMARPHTRTPANR